MREKSKAITRFGVVLSLCAIVITTRGFQYYFEPSPPPWDIGIAIASSPPTVISGWLRVPVTFDGEMTTVKEWSDTTPVDVTLLRGFISTSARIWIKNDDTWLYMLYRVEWPYPDPGDCGFIACCWDWIGEPPPLWDQSDLGLVGLSGTGDYHGWDEYSWTSDLWEGGENNVEGAATYDGTYYWFEFRKELDSGDGYDWAFFPGQIIETAPEVAKLYVALYDATIDAPLQTDISLHLSSRLDLELYPREVVYLGDPTGTQWHELHPVKNNFYHLTSWEPGMVLSPCDQIEMEPVEPSGPLEGFEVDEVTIDLVVLDEGNITHWLDYKCGYWIFKKGVWTSPFNSKWNEIKPDYDRCWHLSSWNDTNGDGKLSYCDYIDMTPMYPYTGNVTWFHVENVTVTLKLTSKLDGTQRYLEFMGTLDEFQTMDYIHDPESTMWHEIWPVQSRIWHLNVWEDSLVLSPSDQIVLKPKDVFGVDWWPMFHHDPSHTGYSTSTAPNTNNTVWNYTTGPVEWCSPAVADAKVYVGSEDKVYCLGAATGAHVWNYTTWGYVRSSPAVADGRVFVGSTDSKVYCLDAATGAHVWNYTTGGDVWSSPAVADGKVYVGSDDGKVYCLDALTGAHIWNYTTGHLVISSPAVADGKVYVGSEDFKVYAFADARIPGTEYHVDKLTVAMNLTDVDDVTHIVKFEGSLKQFMNYHWEEPVSTQWHEVNPDYCRQWHLWDWWDSNGNGILDHCDEIVMMDKETGWEEWFHVEALSTDIIVTLKVHDVAVIDVTPIKTIVGQGYNSKINVTVANDGDFTETFNVTAYYNSKVINYTTVTNLPSGEEITITFTWNTTGVAKGNYTITAKATPIPGETDTTDNTHIDGWIIIAMIGDITGATADPLDFVPDGKVDMKDISTIARYFGQTVPPAPSNCDITGPTTGVPDGKIDMRDVATAARHFGETDP